jgi:protein-disulfide isomerase
MSKRQEIRQRRQKERTRNRVLVISLVAVGALLIASALILPGISKNKTPVIAVTPKAIYSQENGSHLGDPNAPVKVDIFEDFRCSGCLYYHLNIEPQIIQTYVITGKVYYSFHSYLIIDINDGSDASYRSINAALCAGEQGRFWDFHDTLFANQVTESASLFTDERLNTMAQNLKLDMSAFNQCYKAKRFASEIQDDMTQAQTLQLRGTPSALVNGTLVQVDQLASAIDTALAGK